MKDTHNYYDIALVVIEISNDIRNKKHVNVLAFLGLYLYIIATTGLSSSFPTAFTPVLTLRLTYVTRNNPTIINLVPFIYVHHKSCTSPIIIKHSRRRINYTNNGRNRET